MGIRKLTKADVKEMAKYHIGQTVEYYSLIKPRGDLIGSAEIYYIGELCHEPVVWLKGVSGAYSVYAIKGSKA